MVILELVDGKTTNFAISYQTDLSDALKRAKALKATCEDDFKKLRQWFGITDGFGPSNRVKLIIDRAGYGSNGGYSADGRSSMLINAFDGSGSIYADDAVRAIFVAEMAEILMSYNINVPGRTPSWQPMCSDGEGLARVAAAMFYNDAYYLILVSNDFGPPVNEWLLGSRTADWISKRKLSDVDKESYGCSILFIYYLHSQLGYSMESIVRKAGASLEETYKSLTGKSDGYKAFTELLSKYFPIGKTGALPFDNPFPLLDSKKRSVEMSFDESPNGPSKEVSSGTAKLSPFHTSTCPVKDYNWTIANIPQKLLCTASATGFGLPTYKWRINGRELNSGDRFSTTTPVQLDNPDNPYHPSSSVKKVQLHCEITSEAIGIGGKMGLGGRLWIYNDDYPGHIILNVEVDVQEAYASADVTSDSSIGILDSQVLTYEDKYYKDRANCAAAYDERIRHTVQKVSPFFLLLTKPDPPPNLVKGIRVLGELRTQIEKIATKQPKLAHQIAAILAHNLNVPGSMLIRGKRIRRNPKSRIKTKKKKQKKIR